MCFLFCFSLQEHKLRQFMQFQQATNNTLNASHKTLTWSSRQAIVKCNENPLFSLGIIYLYLHTNTLYSQFFPISFFSLFSANYNWAQMHLNDFFFLLLLTWRHLMLMMLIDKCKRSFISVFSATLHRHCDECLFSVTPSITTISIFR